MVISVNNNVTNVVLSRYSGREITIGIDSSKTNSALAVGDETGKLIDIIELNGSGDGTTEEAVLKLCEKQRQALRSIFGGAHVAAVGIEDIITKNNGQKESGITVHTSRFKITAVFMSFIFFFQETFGITPELINNWEWKHAVLPEQFRSRDIKKGSLEYFRSTGSKYGNYTDDATDSICILKYLCSKKGIVQAYKIREIETPKIPYRMFLMSESCNMDLTAAQLFEYNSSLNLKQNADVMANVIGRSKAAVSVVRTADLRFEDIYGYCSGAFKHREDNLKLIVLCDK